MGLSSSSALKSQEVGEFRQLTNTGEIEQYDIPERPENRSRTDKNWIVVFLVAIVVLIPFSIYTLVYSDIRRFSHGVDKCGNLCGYQNPKVDGISCSGVDYTNEPYGVENELLFSTAECVRTCPADYTKYFFLCLEPSKQSLSRDRLRRSINDNYSTSENDDVKIIILSSDEATYYLHRSWWKILISIMITIAIAVLGLFMFRFATAVLVWSILVFSSTVIVLLAIGLWIAYLNIDKDQGNTQGLLVVAIIVTILALGVILLLAVLFKKIKLVILLYKETTKAVFAMPMMILIPVATAIVELFAIILFVFFAVVASTAGSLTQVMTGFYIYDSNFVMTFTQFFAVVITIWFVQFLIGIQYMVVAGSVSTWYFSKNKPYLDSPILTSFKNTMTFHLGTIALGSLVITIATMIKNILRSLTKNGITKAIVDFCLSSIEEFVKFLSKNAYVETALHGQPFFRSGKRAAKLLLANAKSLIAVNSVGDFVLGMAQLILIVVATGISYTFFMESPYFWLPLLICFILNILIVSVSFGVFETTVDTLFVCFCEDKEINDGLSRPYAMSRGLMEFVENSKIVYSKLENQTNEV